MNFIANERKFTMENLLTVGKAAKLKGCSRRTIYNLIKAGKLNTDHSTGRRLIKNDSAFHEVELGRPSLGRLESLEVHLPKLESIDDWLPRLESLEARLESIEVYLPRLESIEARLKDLEPLDLPPIEPLDIDTPRKEKKTSRPRKIKASPAKKSKGHNPFGDLQKRAMKANNDGALESITGIAKEVGVHRETIRRICEGKIKSGKFRSQEKNARFSEALARLGY